MSNRDPHFTSAFWLGLQKALGTRLDFGTPFHPQTDVQTKRQNLEDILCFAYSMLREVALSSHYLNDTVRDPLWKMCRSPLCWDEVCERKLVGPELVLVANDIIK